jgi:hypothetical protein
MTGATFKISGRELSESFVRIVDGIAGSPLQIPTGYGNLLLLYHHNAILNQRIKTLPKPFPPTFSTFESYRQYLQSVCTMIARNAASVERSNRYRLLASISSGYDSAACATVAREVGCSEAITFRTARGGLSDQGTGVGQMLGLQITTVERLGTTEGCEGFEAEFLSTGMQGEDFPFVALRDILPGRVFVTGFHGGEVWNRHVKPSEVIKSRDLSGSSLREFRLSRDFIHLPMPFVGALQHADIARISNSPEMRPYCVGGRYDRPIPRRIVEDAGVPREMFGQSKKAASILLFRSARFFSAATRRAIRESTKVPRSRYWLECLQYQFGMAVFLPQKIVGRLLPTKLRRYVPDLARTLLGRSFPIYEHTHPFMAPALDWALAEVSKRYSIATGWTKAPAVPDGTLDMPDRKQHPG